MQYSHQDDCISKKLKCERDEFPLLEVTGFNQRTKNCVTFQLKFYFLKMKGHYGNTESTSECSSENSFTYCSFGWR